MTSENIYEKQDKNGKTKSARMPVNKSDGSRLPKPRQHKIPATNKGGCNSMANKPGEAKKGEGVSRPSAKRGLRSNTRQTQKPQGSKYGQESGKNHPKEKKTPGVKGAGSPPAGKSQRSPIVTVSPRSSNLESIVEEAADQSAVEVLEEELIDLEAEFVRYLLMWLKLVPPSMATGCADTTESFNGMDMPPMKQV